MKELLSALCQHLQRQIPVAIATVIHQEGSTPRGAGSKMLVDSEGLIHGTIGGGLAEGEAIKICQQALQSQKAEVMHFTLTGEMAAQSEMICGGLLHIAIEPIVPHDYNIAFYQKLLATVDAHETLVLTVWHDAEHLSRSLCIDGVWDMDTFSSNEPFPITHLSEKEKNSLIASLKPDQETAYIQGQDGCTYTIEKYPPVWKMVIAGGGHVSLFTAQVAAMAGFSVIVLDDREEFSKAERFPQADATHTVPQFENCFASCTPTKHTCIVIVTRGHLHDKTVLQQALQTKAGYIGMIGSSRKRKQVYEALRAEGITQDVLNKVFSPIGLSIKAETPEEIGVSIVAECIAFRREAWDILQRSS